MTTLDEERLSGLRQLVPPVLSPPISDVHRRATRLRRRRRAYQATGVVGVVTVGVLAFTVVPNRFEARSPAGPASSASAVPELSCLTAVTTSPLPVWARTGFTPPDQAIAHVTGSQGNIVGVLFGDLHSPPAADQGNKILWVARVAGGSGDPDLKIHATLNGSQRRRRSGGDRRSRTVSCRCAASRLLDVHPVLVWSPGGGRPPVLVTAG